MNILFQEQFADISNRLQKAPGPGMNRPEAVLHPAHNLAFCQDQDNRARQDKAKIREKRDEKLQKLQRENPVE